MRDETPTLVKMFARCRRTVASLALLVGLLAEPAVRLLGGSGEVLDITVTYLRISAVGLPFVLVALVGNGVLRGVADLRRRHW